MDGNIKVLNLNKFISENKITTPITNSNIFMGRTFNFHPEGLFSEDIFGIEGSKERGLTYSYINLHTHIIHPIIYNILKRRIFTKIDDLISGEKAFNIDENRQLIEDEEGEITGITSLVENIKKVRFLKGEDTQNDRSKLIDMIHRNIDSGHFFINKLLVVPPKARPINIDEKTKEVQMDDLNELYQKAIRISLQARGSSGVLLDILSFRLQKLMVELFELLRVKVSKKSGVLRNLMLGRRVDFSARAVITPNPNLNIGQVGIPLKIVSSLFEPNIMYGLVNSPYTNKIPQEFHDEVKRFLGKEIEI
ncbi:MAG: hypothetical protein ACOCQD_00850 [archaeon]